jgi:hypothetical protein
LKQPSDLPVLIEVAADRHKPFELCTRDELWAYAMTLMGRAIVEARDAAETAELDGGESPVTEALMHQSSEHFDRADALIAHLTNRAWRPDQRAIAH